MKRLLYILLIVCLTVVTAQAQWSAKDSLWLRDILSGKDTLRLNPETMESIRIGTFLNPEKLQMPMGSAPLELPITKDFREYFEEEDTTVSKAFGKLTDLPPHVVLRYYNPKMPENRLEFSDEYFYFYLKNIARGMKASPGHDFAHILNTAFSPEYRQLMRNRKNAAKLNEYGELPSAELHRKLRQFQEEHPELIKPVNAAEAAKRDALIAEKERSLRKDSLSTSQSSSEPDSIFVESQEDPHEYKTLPN